MYSSCVGMASFHTREEYPAMFVDLCSLSLQCHADYDHCVRQVLISAGSDSSMTAMVLTLGRDSVFRV